MDVSELAARIWSTDPAVSLRAVTALRRLADQVETAAVAHARDNGWSWDQIGDALDVSRQSAHEKHGKTGRPGKSGNSGSSGKRS